VSAAPRGSLGGDRPLADLAATRALGAELGAELRAGEALLLEGELGSGKTSLVQGLAEALGVEGRVTSPTFAFCNRLSARDGLELHHYDLYRAEDLRQVLRIGFEESLESGALVVVEWPRIALPLLREPALLVRLYHTGDARAARFGWLDAAGLRAALGGI
jgi:tRNA threonylcarbamoyladenosine biosynthesis protein TsaE